MAEQQVQLRIVLNGQDVAINNIKDLKTAIQNTNKVLEETQIGSKKYQELGNEVAEAKSQLKTLTEEQQKFLKEANYLTAPVGSMKALRIETSLLREEANNLNLQTDEGKAKFTQLQVVIDKNAQVIRNFDRELSGSTELVGEYSRGIQNAFAKLGLTDALKAQLTSLQNIEETLIAENKKLAESYIQMKANGETAFEGIETKIIENNEKIIEAQNQIKNLNSQLNGSGVQTATKRFDSLGFSMAQLTREAPAFANSVQTGFMAISNNLPMLFDALQTEKKIIDEIKASGQQAPSIWKSISNAVFSFNTLMSVGITLMVVYGKEIGNFISTLIKGNPTLDITKKTLSDLTDIMKDAAKQASKENIEMSLLFKQARDLTLTYEQRKSAVDELRSKYPQMLKDMSDEKILAGQTAEKETQLTDAILSRAKASAAIERITKNQSDILDIEEKRLATTKELDLLQSKYGGDLESEKLPQIIKGNAQYSFELDKQKQLKKDILDFTKQITSIEETNNRLTSVAYDNQVKAIKAGKEVKDGKSNELQLFEASVEIAKKRVALEKDGSQKMLEARIELAKATALLEEQQVKESVDSSELKAAKIGRIEAELHKTIADLYRTDMEVAKNSNNLIAQNEKKNHELKKTRFSEEENLFKQIKEKQQAELELTAQIEQAKWKLTIEIANSAFTIMENNARARYDAEKALEDKKAKELKKQLDNKKITQKQYDTEIEKLNEEAEKRERKYQHDAAVRSKLQSAFQIGVNTAMAIMQINANPAVNADITQTLRTTLTALVAGIGAAQLAAVASQKVPAYAVGTEYVNGAGTTTSDSIPARLSVGERVVPANINEQLGGIRNADLPKLINGNLLSLPSIPSSGASQSDLNNMFEVITSYTDAVNRRIDRLQVFNNATETKKANDTFETIKQAQTF